MADAGRMLGFRRPFLRASSLLAREAGASAAWWRFLTRCPGPAQCVGESCSCVAADDQAHCCEQPHGIVGDAEFPHADDGGSVSGRSNSTRGIVLPMQYSIAR